MIKTSNPALNANTFEVARSSAYDAAMTIQGTVNKTGLLLVLLVVSASWTWKNFYAYGVQAVAGWMTGGAIAGLIIALVTIFNKKAAPWTSPVYALAEGLVLGGLSGMLEKRFPGIAIQAVGLTLGTLFFLLMAYKSGLIRATEKFKLGIVAATGGIFLVYMITMVLGFFKVSVPFIYSNGLAGIGFSLFVVVIAALNLILDFDFIEKGAAEGAPKYMEWYAAFGLMVTLVWLYIEILRLLVKLRSRE